MSKKKLVLILMSLAIGAVLAGSYLYHQREELPSQGGNDSASVPIGGPFTLMNSKGMQLNSEALKGKYALIYFGYSFCPDICPTALEGMTEALKLLGQEAQKVQPVFITVDPKRDTVSHLERYMENFHPSFIALTGSEVEIEKTLKAYRVYAVPVYQKGATEYMMDHSSIIYLMGPEGQFIMHFDHQTPGHEMAFKIREVLKQGT